MFLLKLWVFAMGTVKPSDDAVGVEDQLKPKLVVEITSNLRPPGRKDQTHTLLFVTIN